LGIDPDKIGFMGFSDGGAATMPVIYNATKESRPNFIVPAYP
jgi:predicted esterase